MDERTSQVGMLDDVMDDILETDSKEEVYSKTLTPKINII